MSRLAVILLLVAQAAWAADQEFAFALPELKGTISLGIFDAKGKLVRTLAVNATEKDFKVGLNGLIAKWDGKDDAGQDVPPGKYQADGYVVGPDLKAEGMAYHFNDWIESDDSPPIGDVSAVIPAKDESFFVFGIQPVRDGLPQAFLWNFEASAGLRPVIGPLPSKASLMTSADDRVLFADREPSLLSLYQLADPANPVKSDSAGFSSGAFWKNHLFLLGEGGGLQEFDPANLAAKGKVETPAAFSGIDANAAALIGWDAKGVWLRRDKAFAAAPLAELPGSFSVSAGPGETLWLIGGQAPDFVVRQHAFDGELLRELKLSEEKSSQARLFASKDGLNFFVKISYLDGRETLRGYRPAKNPADPAAANWEIFLEKSIEDCRFFGWDKDHLVAKAGETPPPNEFKITLPASDLNGKAETLAVTGVGRPGGLWLQTRSGLPLFCLTTNPTFQRVLLVPGDKPNTVRLFAGNGAVVAEYLLTNLDNVAPIEAGEIEVPPTKSSP